METTKAKIDLDEKKATFLAPNGSYVGLSEYISQKEKGREGKKEKVKTFLKSVVERKRQRKEEKAKKEAMEKAEKAEKYKKYLADVEARRKATKPKEEAPQPAKRKPLDLSEEAMMKAMKKSK